MEPENARLCAQCGGPLNGMAMSCGYCGAEVASGPQGSARGLEAFFATFDAKFAALVEDDDLDYDGKKAAALISRLHIPEEKGQLIKFGLYVLAHAESSASQDGNVIGPKALACYAAWRAKANQVRNRLLLEDKADHRTDQLLQMIGALEAPEALSRRAWKNTAFIVGGIVGGILFLILSFTLVADWLGW